MVWLKSMVKQEGSRWLIAEPTSPTNYSDTFEPLEPLALGPIEL